jgi:hypothetical protein
MKTKSKSRRNVLGSSGFFLVLLLSSAARAYAEDRATDRPAVQTKEEDTIKRNEQPMPPDSSRDSPRLVGPSAEEIHDFLYPTTEDDKVLTRAN